MLEPPDDGPLAGWLTVDEAARQLRVSSRTIYAMIADGRLAAIKHCNQLFFAPGAINSYVQRLIDEAEQARVEAEAEAERARTQSATPAEPRDGEAAPHTP